jgi:hypothetical protein
MTMPGHMTIYRYSPDAFQGAVAPTRCYVRQRPEMLRSKRYGPSRRFRED